MSWYNVPMFVITWCSITWSKRCLDSARDNCVTVQWSFNSLVVDVLLTHFPSCSLTTRHYSWVRGGRLTRGTSLMLYLCILYFNRCNKIHRVILIRSSMKIRILWSCNLCLCPAGEIKLIDWLIADLAIYYTSVIFWKLRFHQPSVDWYTLRVGSGIVA